jgi:hypothetical protein
MNHQSDKTHNLLILRLPLWNLEKEWSFCGSPQGITKYMIGNKVVLLPKSRLNESYEFKLAHDSFVCHFDFKMHQLFSCLFFII